MAKSKKVIKKYYRRKGRWSANIRDIEDNQTVQGGWQGNSIDLCLNPPQNNLTVSQQYTVKNIELSVFLETETSTTLASLEDVQHYIMYVPQGMTLNTDYNLEHPEYIMAYYYQGNPSLDGSQNNGGLGYKLKIKTRMARRLQTGDKIIYFWKCRNETTGGIQVSIRGLVRWWTKAN